MLTLAVLFFWTGAVGLLYSVIRSAQLAISQPKRLEAQRVLDESPYLQHLGLTVAKPKPSYKLIIGLGLLWALGLAVVLL
jgi:hypothetical protein